MRLLPLIYGTAEKPRAWPLVLEGISRALHGECTLDCYEPQKGEGRLFRTILNSHSRIKRLDERYAGADGFLERAQPFLRSDVRLRKTVLSPDSLPWHNSESKLCLRNSTHSFALGCPVPVHPFLVSFFSCHRPRRNGPYLIGDKQFVRALLPHFRRTLQLTHKLEELESKAVAFDSLSVGVITMDRKGSVLSLNRTAQSILDRKDGLSISAGGIATAFPAAQEQLSQLLAAAAHSSLGGRLVIPRPSGNKPFVLQICPHRALSASSARNPVATLFILDFEFTSHDLSGEISRLYELTPAEFRIARMIAEGKGTKEIQAQLDISPETTKTHLKHIFLKVGVRRQSELVSVLLRANLRGAIS